MTCGAEVVQRRNRHAGMSMVTHCMRFQVIILESIGRIYMKALFELQWQCRAQLKGGNRGVLLFGSSLHYVENALRNCVKNIR